MRPQYGTNIFYSEVLVEFVFIHTTIGCGEQLFVGVAVGWKCGNPGTRL
jgi:hypothetical protein